MATLPVSVPTVSCASGSRSSVARSVGLATLIMCLPVFVLGMMLPEPSLHPIEVLAGAGNRAGAGQDAAGRAATRTPQSLSRFAPVVDWPAPDRRSPALTTSDGTKVEPLGPVRSGSEGGSQSGMAANSLEAAWERGTRGESAHVAALPLHPEGRDIRWDLLEMAAAQHRDWTQRCPCPVYPSGQPGGGPR
jgi:hypothetical protein